MHCRADVVTVFDIRMVLSGQGATYLSILPEVCKVSEGDMPKEYCVTVSHTSISSHKV
jgi:hypothetical protein